MRAGGNLIAVDANSAYNADIAPLSGDFTTFGGLHRSVHLLALNPVSISPLDDAGPVVYLTTQAATVTNLVISRVMITVEVMKRSHSGQSYR